MKFPCSTQLFEDALPHRRPALWIDEVLWVSADRGACGVRYDSCAPYVSRGTLTETCYVEWMAQSYGFVKAAQTREAGETVGPTQEAFLAAISNFQIVGQPNPIAQGALFEIEVRETHRLGPLTLVEGQVKFDGKILATASLKVFNR